MSRKILIIDDDELVALSLEGLLGSEGFSVQAASNGQDALAKAASERFDAVLLDVIMPGMSGFEVCRRLRETEGYKTTPIIMLTAKSAEADRERGLAAGATRFLPKPTGPDELLKAIKAEIGE